MPAAQLDADAAPPVRAATAGWDRLLSWPNAVTLVRTVLAVGLGLVAVVESSARLAAIAYAVYWTGDILDGLLARRLDQETRIGAILDIVSDRACSAVLVCALVTINPSLWLALAIFLVQFMVVDCVLSLAFLRWPLLSPNYFGRVDAVIYRYNWSPPAKAVNTAGVVLAVAAGSAVLATVIAVAQLALKCWSVRRLVTLPVPGDVRGP